jgi:hypothetical protein
MKVPKQILIAMPTYSGQIPIEVVHRLTSMKIPEGYSINFTYIKGMLIAESRYMLAKKLIECNNDYLFFWDSDQIPSQDAIAKMLELDKDIVGCPIPSRRGAKFVAVFDEEGDRLSECDGTGEVGAVGMATTLIKRKVIDKMIGTYPNPFAVYGQLNEKGVFVNYSEDIMFCKRAIEQGFEVWCTDEVISKHIGEPVAYWYNKGYHNSFENRQNNPTG